MTGPQPRPALALVEARGLVTVMAALEAMQKEADVQLVTIRGTGGGFLIMVVEGHLAAIHSAVDAATAVAGPMGDLRFVRTIARPDPSARDTVELPWGRTATTAPIAPVDD